MQLLADVVLAMRTDAFQAVIRHDMSFFDQYQSGRIVSRITSDTEEFGRVAVLLRLADRLERDPHLGVVIAAHPFKKIVSANGDGFYGAGFRVYDYDLDGLEVAHPSYDRESAAMAEEAMQKRNIAGIGCSDAHDLRSVGICRSVFPDPITDMEGLCKAIRARRVTARCVKTV